jgi:TDG/mug DNA glycosylase family protein
MARAKEPLPDLLREGLKVVFVGTAAGRRSAAVAAYYAHPGNRFWRVLAATRLTPRLYLPHEYRSLLALGIGFTDMSKSASGMDHEIAKHTFDSTSFERKMRRFRPRAIAFTSKKAASIWLARPTGKITIGRQEKHDDFPQVFVLSSPSGAASGYWDDKPWQEMAAYVRRA